MPNGGDFFLPEVMSLGGRIFVLPSIKKGLSTPCLTKNTVLFEQFCHQILASKPFVQIISFDTPYFNLWKLEML